MVFGEVGDLFGCLVRLEVKRPASLLSLIALARPGAVQLQPSPALPAGSPSTRPAQPEALAAKALDSGWPVAGRYGRCGAGSVKLAPCQNVTPAPTM